MVWQYSINRQAFGAHRTRVGEPKRHLTILYNPVSGDGTAKRIVDKLVTPVLRECKVEYDVIPTQYAGYAKEHLADMGTQSSRCAYTLTSRNSIEHCPGRL